MAEVPFRSARQLSEYKGKGASASREAFFLHFFLSFFLSFFLVLPSYYPEFQANKKTNSKYSLFCLPYWIGLEAGSV